MSWVPGPMIARARAAAEQLLNRVRARRWQAYRALFRPDGTMSDAGEIVMADLRDFCRGRVSTFDENPRRHALLEGRREVYLRIVNALGLEEEELARMDRGRDRLLEESDDE